MTIANKPPAKPPTAPAAAAKPAGSKMNMPVQASPLAFWAIDPVPVDVIASEEVDYAKRARILKVIFWEAALIALLSGALVFGMPLMQPIYQYFALNLDGPKPTRTSITALTMPNMTNQSVLSWSTTSITEIMTIGFGDFNPKLMAQKNRFTEDGWTAFVKAFVKQNVGDTFRANHLVLTTVPANSPIILWQGVNQNKVYQWIVQMPVVMSYATNNNVTKRTQAVITLTIVRVPASMNPSGIAIEKWSS